MNPVAVAPTRIVDGSAVTYYANQPEYIPLPSWRTADGTVVTRWRLSWRERLAAFFGCDLYIEILTFNQPLQPVFLSFSEAEVFGDEGGE